MWILKFVLLVNETFNGKKFLATYILNFAYCDCLHKFRFPTFPMPVYKSKAVNIELFNKSITSINKSHAGKPTLSPRDDLFGIARAVGDDVEEHEGVEEGGPLVARQKQDLAYLEVDQLKGKMISDCAFLQQPKSYLR